MDKTPKVNTNNPELLKAVKLFASLWREEVDEIEALSNEEAEALGSLSFKKIEPGIEAGVEIETNYLFDRLMENTLLVEAAMAKDYSTVASNVATLAKLEEILPKNCISLPHLMISLIETTATAVEQDGNLSASVLKAIIGGIFQHDSAIAANIVSNAISKFCKETELDEEVLIKECNKHRSSIPGEIGEIEDILGSLKMLANLMSKANNKKPD